MKVLSNTEGQLLRCATPSKAPFLTFFLNTSLLVINQILKKKVCDIYLLANQELCELYNRPILLHTAQSTLINEDIS